MKEVLRRRPTYHSFIFRLTAPSAHGGGQIYSSDGGGSGSFSADFLGGNLAVDVLSGVRYSSTRVIIHYM